jgi:hypothetical protein
MGTLSISVFSLLTKIDFCYFSLLASSIRIPWCFQFMCQKKLMFYGCNY